MTDGLWRFALTFYAMPDVSAACLTLQDQAGIDVVQLLVVVYGDCIGRPLDIDGIGDLRHLMAEWREQTVVPLRAVRRYLKAPVPGFDADKEALRETVKAAELGAERLQLAMSEAWLIDRGQGQGVPIREALQHLIRRSSGDDPLSPAVREAAATIIAARMAMRQRIDEPVPPLREPHGEH